MQAHTGLHKYTKLIYPGLQSLQTKSSNKDGSV